MNTFSFMVVIMSADLIETVWHMLQLFVLSTQFFSIQN